MSTRTPVLTAQDFARAEMFASFAMNANGLVPDDPDAPEELQISLEDPGDSIGMKRLMVMLKRALKTTDQPGDTDNIEDYELQVVIPTDDSELCAFNALDGYGEILIAQVQFDMTPDDRATIRERCRGESEVAARTRLGEGTSRINENLEDDVEEVIDELRADPAFSSVDDFIAWKLGDDQFSYDFTELQALARNMTERETGRRGMIAVASPGSLKAVKDTLNDMGFKFIPREKIRSVRGVSSNPNGTHPFAGSGGGGTGFGTGWGGGGFTSHGGGPGAMGGGKEWTADDPTGLGMGAKKEKKERGKP